MWSADLTVQIFLIYVPPRSIQQVLDLKNTALETEQAGTATANLITATAQANYTAILEGARVDGLKNAFTVLGLSTQEYKNSFDYLRTLKGTDKAHFTVDFQQRIVGNLN